MSQKETIEETYRQMNLLEEKRKNLKGKEYFAQFNINRINPELEKRIIKNGLKGLKPIEEIMDF